MVAIFSSLQIWPLGFKARQAERAQTRDRLRQKGDPIDAKAQNEAECPAQDFKRKREMKGRSTAPAQSETCLVGWKGKWPWANRKKVADALNHCEKFEVFFWGGAAQISLWRRAVRMDRAELRNHTIKRSPDPLSRQTLLSRPCF
ncbi:MAG: hypothetical protein ACFB6R_04045 [Alphaproteobacteria bacterium]